MPFNNNYQIGITDNPIIDTIYSQRSEIYVPIPPHVIHTMDYEDGDGMLFEDGTAMQYEG